MSNFGVEIFRNSQIVSEKIEDDYFLPSLGYLCHVNNTTGTPQIVTVVLRRFSRQLF